MNYQQRKHQSEVMKAAWVRRNAANMVKAEKKLNAIESKLDSIREIKKIYLLTFYRDGGVISTEVF